MWILDLLWGGAGYVVARVILPLVSFGKVQAAPLDSRGSGFSWRGYRRNESGHLEIESTVATGIGLVVCCLGLVVVLQFVH